MKFTKYINPVTGSKGDLSFENIFGMVLGSVVFLGTFWAGEWVINEIKGTTGVNLQPNDPFKTPQPAVHNQPAHTGPNIL